MSVISEDRFLCSAVWMTLVFHTAAQSLYCGWSSIELLNMTGCLVLLDLCFIFFDPIEEVLYESMIMIVKSKQFSVNFSDFYL